MMTDSSMIRRFLHVYPVCLSLLWVLRPRHTIWRLQIAHRCECEHKRQLGLAPAPLDSQIISGMENEWMEPTPLVCFGNWNSGKTKQQQQVLQP